MLDFLRRYQVPVSSGIFLLLATMLVLTACVDTPIIERLAPVTGADNATVQSSKPKAPLYKAMTREDRRIADRTVRKALETALSGTTFRWQNSKSGHSGTITPQSTYKTKSGLFCRTYLENLTIASRTEQYRDRACRDKAGIWRTVPSTNS